MTDWTGDKVSTDGLFQETGIGLIVESNLC